MRKMEYSKRIIIEVVEEALQERKIDSLHTAEIQRRAEKRGVKCGTFYAVLSELTVKRGRLKRKPLGRGRILYPSEDYDVIAKMIEERVNRKGKEIPYESRVSHTKDLKKIIKRWIKEIPYPDNDVHLYCKKGEIPLKREGVYVGTGKDIPVEFQEEDLFLDLEKHLPYHFDGDLFDNWGKFKERYAGFEGEKIELYREISKKLSKDFDSTVVDYGKRDKGTIIDYLPKKLTKDILDFYEGKTKSFDCYLCNEPTIESTEGYICCKIEGSISIIAKEGESKKDFEERIKKGVDYFRKIKETFKENSTTIINIKKELESNIKNITTLLKRNLNVIVYKGDCPYLVGGNV